MKNLEQNQVSRLVKGIGVHGQVQVRTQEALVCMFSEKLANESQMR